MRRLTKEELVKVNAALDLGDKHLIRLNDDPKDKPAIGGLLGISRNDVLEYVVCKDMQELSKKLLYDDDEFRSQEFYDITTNTMDWCTIGSINNNIEEVIKYGLIVNDNTPLIDLMLFREGNMYQLKTNEIVFIIDSNGFFKNRGKWNERT